MWRALAESMECCFVAASEWARCRVSVGALPRRSRRVGVGALPRRRVSVGALPRR
eukprot:CAMPEP_0171902886 /NCGR_PEP_ID=MMETSP0993-20121228/2227_1 /TAXON_ID=483369 /ORGANISM="non described non described, Strain CCMP2098" /LENGTH=54 /DNA_ID=CAMNT_0012532679 /DNA_START=143 /DNA_END=303 /DNA_ORIENTATION=-